MERNRKWEDEHPNYRKEYYKKVKDSPEYKKKASEQGRNWRVNNKEKVNQRNKNWRTKNPDKIRESRKKAYDKIKSNPILSLHQKIRGVIKGSFKRGEVKFIKKRKSEDILGCSFDFFREYILSQCPTGITLDNFGPFGYHLDHKIPISTAKTVEDIIKLNHYTNFQPLWWSDNLSKSNKILV